MKWPDWLRFRRQTERPNLHDVEAKRIERERDRAAAELVGMAEFRATCHDELDDLADEWLTTRDEAKAADLHRRAIALQAVVIRLQVRASRHHDAVTGQTRRNNV